MTGPKKFGTFAGVYTPSVLTILGVIMYMRLGWVVGEAGLYAALAIIIMSHVISVTTGLSISSIATDKKIKTGGIYYLLSRSLGFPMGGSIGITLFVGTALSIALYIVGFSESFLGIPAVSSFLGLAQDINSYRIVGTAVLIILVILALISTSLALKSQFFILGAIALSLVSIIVGVFLPSNYTTQSIALTPFAEHVPLITVFAIFFPAVTGFTAGVAMSGDLKDPKTSIPKGTLLSILTGLIVYVGLAVLFAAMVDRNLLINDNNFLLKVAWSAPLVIAGIWGATLSSALGGILGGPRIIQAVAMDKIVPRFLAKGVGESNEPRNALIFTFFLAEVGILIGELDAIAEIVSMFYIAAYGFINLAFALESWASTDFRPTFRISKWVGIIGFLASFGVMFQLNPAAMFAAFIIMWAIYFILKRKELKSETGDVWSSVWSSVARTSLTKLLEKQIEERNWKPNIILFSGDKINREHLIIIGKAFIGKFGFLSIFDLVKRDDPEFILSKKEQRVVKASKENTAIFERRQAVRDIYDGILQISSTYGFSGIEPNTVMMGWPRNTESPEKTGFLIRNIFKLDLNLIMMDYDKERKFGKKSQIDIWWHGTGQNGNLALQLVKFIWQDESWARAKLRLMIVNKINSQKDEIYKKAKEILAGLRMEAEIKIINNQVEKRAFYDIVQTESVNSDLIFMAIPDFEKGEEKDFIDKTNKLCENIGTVILIKASSFFKALNIGNLEEKEQSASRKLKSVMSDEKLRTFDVDEINKLTAALSEKLNDLTSSQEQQLREILGFEEKLGEKISAIVRKTSLNLVFAAENSTKEAFDSRLSIIENKLLKDMSELYIAFGSNEDDSSLSLQNKQLASLIDYTSRLINDFVNGLKHKMKIYYPAEALKSSPDDNAQVAFFKARRRFLSKLGIRKIPYTLYVKRIIIQNALPEIYKLSEETLAALANVNYKYYIELQKFSSEIDYIFQELRNGDFDPEVIKSKSEQIGKLYDKIKENFASDKEIILKTAANFHIKLLNIIGEKLNAIHANSTVEEDINVKQFMKRLSGAFNGIPQAFVRNTSLIINRLILNNALLTAKNRLLIDSLQIKKAIRLEFETKVAENQKFVFDKINNFYLKYTKSKKEKPEFDIDISKLNAELDNDFADNLISKSQKRMKRWLGIFPGELELFDSESHNDITINPFSDVTTVKISVRQMMDFMIQHEFTSPVKEIIDELPEKIGDFNKALSDQIRLIEYTIKHDDELLNDSETPEDPGAHIKRRVDETAKEMELAAKYLQETLFRLDSISSSALNKMSVYPFLKAALNMKQYIREHKEERTKSAIYLNYKTLELFVKKLFARAVFSQSRGILFTRSLFSQEENHLLTTEKLLEEYRQTHIDKEVYDKLPFYYKHLFLRKQNYSIDFLVGRKEELKKIDNFIANYRSGFKNALLITGDRHSGKSFIANVMVDKHLDKQKTLTINPPEGGSASFAVFEKTLQSLTESFMPADNIFAAMEKGSTVIFDDFELWWEKTYKGEQTAVEILETTKKHKDHILFVFIINSQSFKVMSKVIAMEKYFSGVVECTPMNAGEINEMIMIRHRIGNLKFEFKGRSEDKFHTWNYAKLFNRYFNYSNGNAGLCLHGWINNITGINGKTISIRLPKIPDGDLLGNLGKTQKSLLLNLVIHNASSASKLTRITGHSYKIIYETLEELMSMGLVIKNANGIYKTDRINHHHIVKYFQNNNML